MKSKLMDLGDGTTMHCWVPKKITDKPALLLIHGLGANAMWQWSAQIRHFSVYFNIYVPDLLFLGNLIQRGQRGQKIFKRNVMKMLENLGVTKYHVVGVSYGGFVGYSLAHMYPDAVQKLVLVASGVCLEEKDLQEGLFKVSDLTTAVNILLPQTATNLKTLMKMSFFKAPKMVPSCLLKDFILKMVIDRREERIELVNHLIAGKKASDLPVISQETLLIWGEHDQIFPLELGYRLKRHLLDKPDLVVFKNAGHAVHLEKANKFNSQLKKFLLDSSQKSTPS